MQNFSEPQPKKKNKSVFFHMVRECVASRRFIPQKVDYDNNMSDLLNNSLVAVKTLHYAQI